MKFSFAGESRLDFKAALEGGAPELNEHDRFCSVAAGLGIIMKFRVPILVLSSQSASPTVKSISSAGAAPPTEPSVLCSLAHFDRVFDSRDSPWGTVQLSIPRSFRSLARHGRRPPAAASVANLCESLFFQSIRETLTTFSLVNRGWRFFSQRRRALFSRIQS